MAFILLLSNKCGGKRWCKNKENQGILLKQMFTNEEDEER